LKLIFVVLLIFFVIALFFVGKGYIMYKNALEEIPLKDMIFEIKNKRNYYSVASLPKIYKDAVIAAEDHRFYDHNGFDIIATSRALIHDLKSWSFIEGGSTITQQLAKNIYFTQEKKIERKIAEVFMAFNIERNYEKDEILELYLNTSYFGDGYYTAKEAARGYFDKELMECQKYRELFFSQSKSPKGGGESVWTAITMIAVVIAVVCVAVNQIITNFTITELQSQQQQLEQQLEQLRTQQSE